MMTLAERILRDARVGYWPPALLATVLDKVEAEGYDLSAPDPREEDECRSSES